MNYQGLKKLDLPDSPGVYFFLGSAKDEVLYVGKATSLKDRVASYFSNDLLKTRGPLIVRLVQETKSITFEPTDSVLEALILETNYIKKYQPPYNSREKDDKSYNYLVITSETFPRILLIRGRELKLKAKSRKSRRSSRDPDSTSGLEASFGPFPHGGQLKEALKIVRRIFPFRDKCTPASEKLKDKNTASPAGGRKQIISRPCFNRQIGLCPGVCTGEISKKDYAKIIRNIKLFFEGRKKQILKNLERQMQTYARLREFEKANAVKRQIFALQHIQDVSLLREEKRQAKSSTLKASFRIEAYDIAHTSGKETVGVMVVIEDSEANKSAYRKFKIKGVGAKKVSIDDVGNLEEVITRRLWHSEWPFPNLIVVDGGAAQRNVVESVLKSKKLKIEIVAVVKNDNHKPREIIGRKEIIERHRKEILFANNEAHRFAILFHRQQRRRMFW